MSDYSGARKPDLNELPQIKDRITFLYLEKCQISRESSAIQVKDKDGTVNIPSAALSVILLGPGTTITHRAIELISDTGISIVWTGEKGVRFYAGGRSLASSARYLVRQAEYVSNQRKHLEVVRKMYTLRFPDEDLDGLTLQQLRGKEGSRMKKIYQEESSRWGVPWNGRQYDLEDLEYGDPVNQALSAGNSCLYGLVHSIICALGLSPGLGFIHVGHEKSFVYDVADLYKADITIPLAFELAAHNTPNIRSAMRRRMRDKMFDCHLIERIVKDLLYLFQKEGEEEQVPDLLLWNNQREAVAARKQYGTDA